MKPDNSDQMTRREREIMNILYKLGTATAAEVQSRLSGEPSYSTVRAQLRILEDKRFVQHQEDGVRFVYRPVTTREKAGRSAVRQLLDTFFDGSPERLVATLLDAESARLSDEELDKLSRLVSDARMEAKK